MTGHVTILPMKVAIVLTLLGLTMSACYAEWDTIKLQRRDLCTGIIQHGRYVYANVTCPSVQPQPTATSF